jgi:hypothetical protein
MMSTAPLVSEKSRAQLEASGLMDPGESVVGLLAGQGRVPPMVRGMLGLLVLPWVLSNWRSLVLTDCNLYVFDVKFRGGAGAVKRVRAKYPRGTAAVVLSEPRGRWRTLRMGDHQIYVANRSPGVERARVFVEAGTG